MQEIKLVMRQIGVPNGLPAEQNGIVSSAEVESHLEYNYLSNGYVVQATHFLGNADNGLGFKILFVLVRDVAPTPSAKEIKK